MLIGNLPEDTSISDDGFLLYSEDGKHALKIKKKNVFSSGVTVYYGIEHPDNRIGLTPKDKDIYFRLNGRSLSDADLIVDIFVYVQDEGWKGSSFASGGSVVWEPVLTNGELIAYVYVDGTKIPVYGPTQGDTVEVDNLLTSGITIGTLTINGTAFTLKAPDTSGSSSSMTQAVVSYYNGNTRTEASLVSGTKVTVPLGDGLGYTSSNGAYVDLRKSKQTINMSNVDFTTDNAASAVTLPAAGRWYISLTAKLTANSTYTATSDEYIYLKADCVGFDNGYIEERIPVILFDGETINDQTIMVSGVAEVSSTSTTITIHLGGNLANSLSASSIAVKLNAFKLGG